MNTWKYISLIILCLISPGCMNSTRKLEIQTFPSQMTFEQGASDGTVSDIELLRGDPLVEVIEMWCRDNTTEWSKSYDTFAPVYLYRTASASLNVRHDFVVANVKQRNGKWIQLIKPTPQGLWDTVTNLAAERQLLHKK
jgi:hypothetical protein